MSKSGIYVIKNLINSKIYIGSTCNFTQRKSRHFTMLKKNIHNNKHLQSSFNKYGEKNFIFEILEFISDKETLTSTEQKYLDLYKPDYNILTIANSVLGHRHSEETKRKIQENSLTRKNHPSTIRALKMGVETTRQPIVGVNIESGKRIMFSSLAEAERSGFGRHTIVKCCKGDKNDYKGFSWHYDTK